jgi:1,2-diacylglycerol-3-alpha-glucose alpha-1,2-galactosyltransferase
MTVHVVSETPFVMKGQGVHTAFLDLIELLREKDGVKVVVNGEGWGDVLHCHTYGPYYFWKGRRYKGKRIYTVHVIPASIKGSLPMARQLAPIVRWYFRIVYNYADALIAISPTVEGAIRELGVTTPIRRIYNPILPARWQRTAEKRREGRARLGLAESDVVVLGVGQLQGRKGVDDFLDVADAIPEAKFVWVGGRPFGQLTEGIARIDQRIAEKASHIKFTGLLDLSEMPSIYAAADIFLFPSYQENCPLAPMEAAACGMPVVFRDIAEYRSLYETSYLKAADADGFITLLRRLMADQEFYAEGVRMSQALLGQFDKDKIRSQLLELYAEVMQRDLAS